MIVSASYRTDIPAFYGAWFLNRLAAGHCMVANPYGGRPYRVALAGPGVDGFVFWTRNAGPFLDALDRVAQSKPFVVQFTVTGYPRALDRSVTDAERAVAQIRRIAAVHGPRAVVWRYDPVLITGLTPPDWHRAAFARLAVDLAGAVDEVVVSFANIYRKTARNLAEAARRHGFDWRDPDVAEKHALLSTLAEIAAGHGMMLAPCTQPALALPGTRPARCVDAARLSDIAAERFPGAAAIRARTKGNRPGCLCDESRDIGAYDTCPHGCVYCYAVRSRDAAQAALRRHDPAGEFLLPPAGAGPGDADGRLP